MNNLESQLVFANQLDQLTSFFQSQNEKAEVFYDYLNGWVIFRNNTQLFIVFLTNYKSSLKTKVNCDSNSSILSISMNRENNFIAYQVTSNMIVLTADYSLGDQQPQIRQKQTRERVHHWFANQEPENVHSQVWVDLQQS